MNIRQLSSSRFIIILSKEDMGAFKLSAEKMNPDDREFQSVLRRLIAIAGERVSISLKNKSMCIETLHREEGCMLIVSVYPKRSLGRKRYKIKEGGSVMFTLDSADAMTDCMAQLYKNGFGSLRGEILHMDGSYCVILAPCGQRTHMALNVLSEYSIGSTKDKIKIAQVREHGTLVSSGFPVMRIGRYFIPT